MESLEEINVFLLCFTKLKVMRFLPGLVLIAFVSNASSQDLPRRPFLGIVMAPLTEEIKARLNYPGNNNGVLVENVLPRSTGAEANLIANDILVKLNESDVASPLEVVQIIKQHPSEPMTIVYWRQGETHEVKLTPQQFPKEKIARASVIYGQIQSGASLLRTITTVPDASGKKPAIFYIQGTGCGSIDFGLDTSNSQFKLIKQFTNAGFITFRVEKTGVGDSRGNDCSETDFNTEANGYLLGLTSLKQNPLVDTNNIFIFGHSMGGVMAPMIAANNSVKGIIVYGTIVKPALEYFIESRRRQANAMELSAGESEAFMKSWTNCAPLYFYSDDSTDRLLSDHPGCRDIIGTLSFRNRKYWQQLASLDIPVAWKKFNGNVLSLWGEFDIIADESDHEILPSVVNQYHKGKGVFMIVPRSTHELFTATSIQTAMYNNSIYNDAAGKLTLEWIRNLDQPVKKTVSNFSDNSARLIFQEDGIQSAYPRWIGSTGKILFQSNRTGNWQLYSIDKNGQNLNRITNDSFNNNYVDVSPGGDKVAFVSDRDGNQEIYVMNIDGSGIKKLTQNPGRDIHPYFSPDSKKILFNSDMGSEGRSFDIYEMNIDGSGLKRLTQTPDEETCARYSHDMKKVLYLRGDIALHNDEVFVMDVASGITKNVTHSISAEGWPSWTKNDAIIFSSDSSGTFNLYTENIDGSDPKRLTTTKFPLRDGRVNVHPVTGEVIFNRQKGETIGIYLLKK